MAIRDIFKINLRTFVNPSAWLDLNNLSYITGGIWGLIKPLFVAPQAPQNVETFEQAQQRLNLTEEDLKERETSYLSFSYIFVISAAIVLIYSLYLLIHHGTWLGFLLGIAATAVFLSQAARFSFWSFQVRHRKLGCTLEEWWSEKISSSNGPKT